MQYAGQAGGIPILKRCGLGGLLAGCMALAGSYALAQPVCNPQLDLHMTDASLEKTLDMLSVEYGFELSFPRDMDRAVSMNARLPLNRLVEKLTKGTNTLMAYQEVDGCEQPELARVVVYPQGGPATASLRHIPVEPPPAPVPQPKLDIQPMFEQQPPAEYIFIGDMERYVKEVIARERKPELNRMTPEQKAEYRHYKSKLKANPGPRFVGGTPNSEARGEVAEDTAATAGVVD